MPAQTDRLVGRPHVVRRTLGAVVGLVLLVIGTLELAVRDNWWGVLVLAAGIWAITELRRKVTVSGDHLVARGRVSRRSVALADLRQVGMSRAANPWVVPQTGRPFHLAMVANDKGLANPELWEFVDLLRARAIAAGASLEPKPPQPTSAPKGAAPLFSM